MSRWLKGLGLFLCLSLMGLAQDAPGRPKIGLVLSGGGARGFGHIGTLQLIDSLNIPIDYIAGTSMGGIMGAFYSIGYDAVEIERLIREMRWDQLFSNNPPREVIPYYERKNDGRFQVELEIKDGRPVAPDGLLSGQKILLALLEHTYAFENVAHFDDLPIPFRCVAVDLVTGNEVILESGSLSKAIRSTMSIPTLFDPVQWGDSLLIDGGLLNNIPVDVVRAMGADIVITCNVGRTMRRADELNSLMDILEQSVFISEYKREAKNLNLSDLVISPELEDLNAADFRIANIGDIIQRGKIAASKQRSKLEQLIADYQLAAPRSEFARKKTLSRLYGLQMAGNTTLPFNYLYALSGLVPGDSVDASVVQDKMRRMRASPRIRDVSYSAFLDTSGDVSIKFYIQENNFPEIAGVVIKGNQRLPHSYVFQKLDIHKGDEFNPKLIGERITQLYGLGVFKHIHYEIEPVDAERIVLTLVVEEQARDALSLGLRYDDYYNLVGIMGVVHEHLFVPGLRFEGELQFAGLERFEARFLYPLSLDGFMIYPLLQLGRWNEPHSIYATDRQQIAIYNDARRKAGFGVGMHPRPNMVFEADITVEKTHLTPEVGQAVLPDLEHDLGYVNFYFSIDDLDEVLITSTGRRIVVGYEGSTSLLPGEKKFSRFEFTADIYDANTHKDNVRFRTRWGFFGGPDDMLYKGFFILGPDDFVGLDYHALSWKRMFLLRFDYRRKVAADWYVKLIANIAPNPTFGDERIYPLDVNMLGGYGAAILYDSILGPVEFTVGRGEEVDQSGEKYWKNQTYFTAGFKF